MPLQDSFLLTSVQVLPFASRTPSSEPPTLSYLHVHDGIIAALGAHPPPQSLLDSLPPGTPVLEKRGHTLIPGLIDAHVHCNDGIVEALEQSLRFGVTTVGDMHNEIESLHKLHKLASDPNNKSRYADIKYAGLAATIDGGWPIPVVTAHDKSEHTAKQIASWPKLREPSSAAPYVATQVAAGASYIKLMHEPGDSLLPGPFPTPTHELQAALVKAAHEHNKLAVAHALSYSGTMAALEAGVDGLTHCFFDREPTDELAALYKKNNAHLNPTLAAIASLTGEGLPLQEAFASDPLSQRLLLSPAENIFADPKARLCSCMGMGAGKGSIANAYATVRRLHGEGVQIVVGSDAATPALGTAYGLSVHHELKVLVKECGLKGYEALWSATAGTAERFGWMDRGVLEVGRKADLVLLKGDPVGFLEGKEAQGMVLPLAGVWRDGVISEGWEEALMD